MKAVTEFKPTIARFKKMAGDFAVLKIAGPKDKIGYTQVEGALKEVSQARIDLTKTAKELRTPAIQLQRAIIEKEKEAKEIIEPVEKMLQIEKNKIDNLDNIKEWQAKLADVGAKIPKKELLEMSSREFGRVYKEAQFELFESQKEKKRSKMEEEFLEENGYDKETDIVVEKEGELRLYKIVNTLKL